MFQFRTARGSDALSLKVTLDQRLIKRRLKELKVNYFLQIRPILSFPFLTMGLYGAFSSPGADTQLNTWTAILKKIIMMGQLMNQCNDKLCLIQIPIDTDSCRKTILRGPKVTQFGVSLFANSYF